MTHHVGYPWRTNELTDPIREIKIVLVDYPKFHSQKIFDES